MWKTLKFIVNVVKWTGEAASWRLPNHRCVSNKLLIGYFGCGSIHCLVDHIVLKRLNYDFVCPRSSIRLLKVELIPQVKNKNVLARKNQWLGEHVMYASAQTMICSAVVQVYKQFVTSRCKVVCTPFSLLMNFLFHCSTCERLWSKANIVITWFNLKNPLVT